MLIDAILFVVGFEWEMFWISVMKCCVHLSNLQSVLEFFWRIFLHKDTRRDQEGRLAVNEWWKIDYNNFNWTGSTNQKNDRTYSLILNAFTAPVKMKMPVLFKIHAKIQNAFFFSTEIISRWSKLFTAKHSRIILKHLNAQPIQKMEPLWNTLHLGFLHDFHQKTIQFSPKL